MTGTLERAVATGVVVVAIAMGLATTLRLAAATLRGLTGLRRPRSHSPHGLRLASWLLAVAGSATLPLAPAAGPAAAAPAHDPPIDDDPPLDDPPPDPLDRGGQAPAAPATRPVVVRPGDSLWSIAAAHLGPRATPARVAAAWPRWWRANRDVIGPDPGVLQPGQRLVPPSP